MPATFTGSQLRELYHLALSCSGNNLGNGKFFQIKQTADLSQHRMQMTISLAMEHSAYFRNYAESLIGK